MFIIIKSGSKDMSSYISKVKGSDDMDFLINSIAFLHKDFEINSYYNLVPTCFNCNNTKRRGS